MAPVRAAKVFSTEDPVTNLVTDLASSPEGDHGIIEDILEGKEECRGDDTLAHLGPNAYGLISSGRLILGIKWNYVPL